MDPALAQAVSLVASGVFMVLAAVAAYINSRAKHPGKVEEDDDDE